MCQIIAITSKDSKELIDGLKEKREIFADLLLEKGEDYFSCGIVSKSQEDKFINFVMSTDRVDWLMDRTLDVLKEASFVNSGKIGIILFSRQKPEMERIVSETQPYVTKDGIVAVHGTIINDQELAKEINVNIDVDTEVFKYLDLTDDHVNGTFSCIQINRDIEMITRDNGLKLWSANIHGSSTHVVATGNLDYLSKEHSCVAPRSLEPPTLFVAFSGGMDIAFSTYKELSKDYYHRAILNYFDWGSAASIEEIKTLEKFRDFYSFAFDIPIEINIINANNYFNEFFDIVGARPKIADINAVGDAAETESPIAYVPFRNSQFALILASIAEGQNLHNVSILFGLNLSEGMVFLDNSEGWLNAITEMIKYGGKDFNVTGSYDVVAPYFSRTKTNMIKEFKRDFPEAFENLLFMSYSCYYPKEDGSACGKCGSCILRAKAEETLIKEKDD